jgi:magnesium and cobalt transporter
MNASDGSSSLTKIKSNKNNSDSSTYQSKIKNLLNNLKQLFIKKPKNTTEILALLKEANENTILSIDALNMIEGVLNVSDMQVRDIMVPRSQMIVIEKDSNMEEILPKMIESGHSRFPVIGNNRDEVLGSLLAKDLLPYILKKDEKINLKELLRPTMIIPESKRLNILLKEFRAAKQHMAIIADEYGGISGLVTIEDVLEQIVGDIEDEFDTAKDSYIVKQKDNVYHVQALTPIELFNEYFKTDFSDEEFDTIGGLVLNAIGHLPKKNESTIIGGFHMKVLNADRRRVRLLQISPDNSTAASNTSSIN